MRFLWKGWPEPIRAGQSQNVILKDILEPGEGWDVVPGHYESDGLMATDPSGAILFHDASRGATGKLMSDNARIDVLGLPKTYTALAVGADSRVYLSRAGSIVTYLRDYVAKLIAHGIAAQHLNFDSSR